MAMHVASQGQIQRTVWYTSRAFSPPPPHVLLAKIVVNWIHGKCFVN